MKSETYTERLRRLLNGSTGQHAQIAKDTGVAQATVSRINAGLCSPRLDTVEKLLGWFKHQDKKAARRSRRKPAATTAE